MMNVKLNKTGMFCYDKRDTIEIILNTGISYYK